MSVHEQSTAPSSTSPASTHQLPFPRRTPARRQRPLVDRLPALAVGLVVVDLLSLAALAVIGAERSLSLGFAGLLLGFRYSSRLYRPRVRLSWLDDIPRSLVTLILALGTSVGVFTLLRGDPLAYPTFVREVVAFCVANELLRLACLAVGRLARRRFGVGENVLILGAGVVGQALASTMLERPELGLRPIGFMDADPRQSDSLVPVLSGRRSELAAVIEQHRVGTVVVSFALAREADLVDTVITAHQMDCTVFVVPRMYELHHDGADVERLRGYPLVRLNPDPTSRPAWWVKRGLDIGLAAVALVLLSPVLAAAALAVLVESGRPVLFHQVRVGLDGKPIRIHKIRSLRPATEDEAQTRWSIATDQRVGAVGRFLRRTSVDELPQLWNILRGDMSFVGPRPERPGFVEVFSIEHERYWARHRVPSGLTGLAQVNGLRGDTSISDRARFDNYYIANWSLWVDLRIVILTIREVLRGAGA